MLKYVEGKISRINVNHEGRYIAFMLENDTTIYRLQYGKFLHREEAQAIDLTQPGDAIQASFYERVSSEIDGTLSDWENQTLDASASSPGDAL